jgi:hypothetical protein
VGHVSCTFADYRFAGHGRIVNNAVKSVLYVVLSFAPEKKKESHSLTGLVFVHTKHLSLINTLSVKTKLGHHSDIGYTPLVRDMHAPLVSMHALFFSDYKDDIKSVFILYYFALLIH